MCFDQLTGSLEKSLCSPLPLYSHLPLWRERRWHHPSHVMPIETVGPDSPFSFLGIVASVCPDKYFVRVLGACFMPICIFWSASLRVRQRFQGRSSVQKIWTEFTASTKADNIHYNYGQPDIGFPLIHLFFKKNFMIMLFFELCPYFFSWLFIIQLS